MPVYLITAHAYRSWSEGNARGYVQRGEGLKPTNSELARWRQENANQPPTRFSQHQQSLLHQVIQEITAEQNIDLHAASVTPTHVHALISFRSPACECGARDHCLAACPARRFAKQLSTRIKRISGLRLGQDSRIQGHKWFSRGEDITPIRQQTHFDYHIREYLPKHEREGGTVKIYGKGSTK